MAGETSVSNEWEVLSMTASTLGSPAEKHEESSSPSSESTELAETKELTKPKEEVFECMQALTGTLHEDLAASSDEDCNRLVSPAKSSKKIGKVSWWKREVIIGQPQSHKYSTVLSIALVAAVVGLVVLGHGWYRERTQLRLELAAKEEKLSDIMQQLRQVKEAVTGRRRIGISRGSFF